MVSVEIELSDASDSSAAASGIDCADFFSFGVFFFFVVLSFDLDFDFRGRPSPFFLLLPSLLPFLLHFRLNLHYL